MNAAAILISKAVEALIRAQGMEHANANRARYDQGQAYTEDVFIGLANDLRAERLHIFPLSGEKP